MAKKDPYPAPGMDRLESLQTPFNIRLYGRPIQGITIAREHLKGPIRARSDLRALRKAVRSLEAPSAQAQSGSSIQTGLAEAAARYRETEQGASVLANVYGYVQGTRRVVLPRPIAFLVDDGGEDASGWDELFPCAAKGFRCWEVDPQEVMLRFDTRQGRLDELLLRDEPPEPAQAGVAEPEGGILIRGADNRLYMVPLALEPFEVRDEAEKSRLLLEAPSAREIKVDSIRSLTGRSTLVARSTLQVRSTLTLRSTLAAANR